MTDRDFETYQRLWEELHGWLNEYMAAHKPDDEDEIRQRLTSEFRFWRRK